MKELFDELFIESWHEQRSYERYFHACAPYSCSYSERRRCNLLYALVTLLSLFGSLKAVMFFVASSLVKIMRRLQRYKHEHNPSDRTPDQRGTLRSDPMPTTLRDRLLILGRRVKVTIATLNLFPTSSDIVDGIYSTRLYIVSLITSVVVLVFYASISVQLQSVTVHAPSQSDYASLYEEHPSTLMCSCSRLSVEHALITHIEPRYHQVCSSVFVKNDGWMLYFMMGIIHSFDFRATGRNWFFMLQAVCKMAEETVINELNVFNKMQFVSTQVVPNDTFNKQMSAAVRQFRQTVRPEHSFSRMQCQKLQSWRTTLR